jgi:hypothetical protein
MLDYKTYNIHVILELTDMFVSIIYYVSRFFDHVNTLNIIEM